jgi:hypothetical protein
MDPLTNLMIGIGVKILITLGLSVGSAIFHDTEPPRPLELTVDPEVVEQRRTAAITRCMANAEPLLGSPTATEHCDRAWNNGFLQ